MVKHLALLVMAVVALTASAVDRPNIIVILADDLGRGDYSAFGTGDIRTPNIDRLCREGMVFNNFYASSCVCSPTRAALLSGCYPDRVGVPGVIREEDPKNSWGFLSPSAVLLPKVLKAAGYHSALVGKWHLGTSSPNLPNERGFDHFHGFLGDMMDDYYTHLRNKQNYMRRELETIDPKGHATDLFTQWACEYLEERGKEDRPFFLYLAYNAPHDPVQPPAEWVEKVKAREAGIGEKRAKLVALIEHMDAGIGQVLAALEKSGKAGNTIVMFTSDNGGVLANGANNGPWRSEKQHMYEGGLRVPFAARWPGKIKEGSSSDRMALSMDIFATAAEAAGVERAKGTDGVSFLPTLLGREQAEAKQEYYFVRREGGLAYGGKTIEALRDGDWKLVQDSPFKPLELFNMKDDPKEAVDLSGKERGVFMRMSAAMRGHVQRGGAVAWQRE